MAGNDNKELMEFLEKKFDGIEKQFDGIEKQFDGVEKRFDGIEKRFDGIEKRFDGIEKQFDDIEKRLELKINAAKEEAMRHTGILIEDVNHKLDLLVEGFKGINQGRDKDNKDNEQEHGRLEKITIVNSADISKLDQRVGKLEGRV